MHFMLSSCVTSLAYCHLLLPLSPFTGVAVRELARHAGFTVDKTAPQVMDFVTKDSSDKTGTLLALDVKKTAQQAVVGPAVKDPVLYSGMAFTMANR